MVQIHIGSEACFRDSREGAKSAKSNRVSQAKGREE